MPVPVTAILLAAGYATRLYPLTKDRPKALLPLAGGVLLDAVVASLPQVPGLQHTVLVTNHRFADQFRAWQRERGAAVEILDDGTETVETRLGAIRDLELARAHRGTSVPAPSRSDTPSPPRAERGAPGSVAGDLLVIGTDNLFDWPIADFVRQAQARAPRASIGLWEAPTRASATQFGVAVLSGDGRITRFVEKSPDPPSTLVALCLYYFPAAMGGRLGEFIRAGGNPDAPGYFLEWLVRQEPVYGLPMRGIWHDIGTLETYEAVVKSWHPAAR